MEPRIRDIFTIFLLAFFVVSSTFGQVIFEDEEPPGKPKPGGRPVAPSVGGNGDEDPTTRFLPLQIGSNLQNLGSLGIQVGQQLTGLLGQFLSPNNNRPIQNPGGGGGGNGNAIGGACQTFASRPGVCTRLNSCQELLEIISSNPGRAGNRILRRSICGTTGIAPLVCCPSPTPGGPGPEQGGGGFNGGNNGGTDNGNNFGGGNRPGNGNQNGGNRPGQGNNFGGGGFQPGNNGGAGPGNGNNFGGGGFQGGNNGGGRPDNGNNFGGGFQSGNNGGGRPGSGNGNNFGGGFQGGNNGGGRPENGNNFGGGFHSGNNGGGRPDNGNNFGGGFQGVNNGGGRPENGNNFGEGFQEGINGGGRPENGNNFGGGFQGGNNGNNFGGGGFQGSNKDGGRPENGNNFGVGGFQGGNGGGRPPTNGGGKPDPDFTFGGGGSTIPTIVASPQPVVSTTPVTTTTTPLPTTTTTKNPFDGSGPVTLFPSVRPGTGALGEVVLTNPRIPGTDLPCGVTDVGQSKIVGGKEAAKGAWPWMAALGYRDAESGGINFLCGGALVSPQHVVTAGHCVHERNDLEIIRFGDHNLYSDRDGLVPVDVPVASVFKNPNYDPKTFSNDIAVIKLKQKVQFTPTVRAICLPTTPEVRTNKFENKSPYIAGWGALNFNGASSATLQQAQVPTIDTSICAEKYKPFKTSKIDDTNICAGYSKGGIDACQGDSGGPLMQPANNGKNYLLIGVVSYGFRCAEPGFPGVYTRVTSYADWLDNTIKSTYDP